MEGVVSVAFKNQENRERWIDNAKGLAILAVIVGHSSSGLQGFLSLQFVYAFHLVVFF